MSILTDKMEEIAAVARARAAASDPSIRGLKTCELEWLDDAEREFFEHLRLLLPTIGKECHEARRRVAEKRARRIAS